MASPCTSLLHVISTPCCGWPWHKRLSGSVICQQPASSAAYTVSYFQIFCVTYSPIIAVEIMPSRFHWSRMVCIRQSSIQPLKIRNLFSKSRTSCFLEFGKITQLHIFKWNTNLRCCVMCSPITFNTMIRLFKNCISFIVVLFTWETRDIKALADAIFDYMPV